MCWTAQDLNDNRKSSGSASATPSSPESWYHYITWRFSLPIFPCTWRNTQPYLTRYKGTQTSPLAFAVRYRNLTPSLRSIPMATPSQTSAKGLRHLFRPKKSDSQKSEKSAESPNSQKVIAALVELVLMTNLMARMEGTRKMDGYRISQYKVHFL